MLWALLASALSGAPTAKDAELVGALIELSRDYVEAVESNKPAGYAAQHRLAERAATHGAELRLSAPLQNALRELATRVEQRAPPLEVHERASAAWKSVLRERRLPTAPSRRPDLERGRGLYRASCAACHGELGGGDGPAAATQAPPPVNFLLDDVMNGLSPVEVYWLLGSGSFESAMPSFLALPEDDRWALAFYVFTLRYAACAAPGRSLPLSVLAGTSDNGLAARYRERALPCARRELALPSRVSGSCRSRAR